MDARSQTSCPKPPPYQLLRQDENYRYLDFPLVMLFVGLSLIYLSEIPLQWRKTCRPLPVLADSASGSAVDLFYRARLRARLEQPENAGRTSTKITADVANSTVCACMTCSVVKGITDRGAEMPA
jgi:hypothetical protein